MDPRMDPRTRKKPPSPARLGCRKQHLLLRMTRTFLRAVVRSLFTSSVRKKASRRLLLSCFSGVSELLDLLDVVDEAFDQIGIAQGHGGQRGEGRYKTDILFGKGNYIPVSMSWALINCSTPITSLA